MKTLPIVLLLIVIPSLVRTQDKPAAKKEYTITGEVVDVACYMAGEARGPSHRSCAIACAKAGGALGLLTVDGKLYVSLLPDDHKNSPNHLLMEHIGHTVEAKGLVRVKGGVNGIMITSVSMAATERKM